MDHLPEGALAPDSHWRRPSGRRSGCPMWLYQDPFCSRFYKISCPTCQMVFPLIQKMIDGVGPGSTPAVFGVSQDEPDPTRQFAVEFGIRFPIMIDPHPYAVSSEYALTFVPTVYLVDQDRTVRIADFGFSKTVLERVAAYFAAEIGGRRRRCSLPTMDCPRGIRVELPRIDAAGPAASIPTTVPLPLIGGARPKNQHRRRTNVSSEL